MGQGLLLKRGVQFPKLNRTELFLQPSAVKFLNSNTGVSKLFTGVSSPIILAGSIVEMSTKSFSTTGVGVMLMPIPIPTAKPATARKTAGANGTKYEIEQVSTLVDTE